MFIVFCIIANIAISAEFSVYFLSLVQRSFKLVENGCQPCKKSLEKLIIRYSYSFLISQHIVISSVVERSLHALRLVEMTGGCCLAEMTGEGRLVEMADFLVSLILSGPSTIRTSALNNDI